MADGNSVLLVDHDTQILTQADWLIEMGPQAGAQGGQVIAQGTMEAVAGDPASQIGPFLSGRAQVQVRSPAQRRSCSGRGPSPLPPGPSTR